jgi:hypothetical protein
VPSLAGAVLISVPVPVVVRQHAPSICRYRFPPFGRVACSSRRQAGGRTLPRGATTSRRDQRR